MFSVLLVMPAAMQGAPHGAVTAPNAQVAARLGAPGAPILPPVFAGLPREGSITVAPMPPETDAPHAAIFKEDGLIETSSVRYGGAPGWGVSVLRFGDATGAYAAWTSFREPAMRAEAAGDHAAADPGLFLAQRSNALVLVHGGGASGDATRLGPAVQALLASLPVAGGPDAVLPSLPGLMPAEGLDKGTLRYAIGAAGYRGPLPAQAIDWSRDAEAATAEYRLGGGASATLTLLMLPTPQIAGASVHAITGLADASLHVATRRTGPLVGVVSGAGVSQASAERLLGQIHYVSDLTLNQPQGYVSEVAKTAKLLLGIGYMVGILAVAALFLGLFLGGGRVLVRRLRGKPASSMHDEDFISLKL